MKQQINIDSPITVLRGVNAKIIKQLKTLNINTVYDLLFYLPKRYNDFSIITKIKDAKIGQVCTISGTVINIENKRAFRARMNITEATINDGQRDIKAVWYNQPFLIKNIHQGDKMNIAGKIAYYGNLVMQNPAYEVIHSDNTTHTGRLVPVYKETKGLTSRWIRYIVKNALPYLNQVQDMLPEDLKKRRGLISIHDAIEQIHFPESRQEKIAAKRRFSFDELFLIQLAILNSKKKIKSLGAPKIIPDIEFIKSILNGLPFELTQAQKKTSWQIMKDMETETPMNRLVEGDVGSGKTLVAIISAANAAKNSFQSAFMAPTEILAIQHFNALANILKNSGITFGLLTSSESKAYEPELGQIYSPKKTELLKMIGDGKIDILVGTHSLIQESVKFKNLGLLILDEQHRFGVNQRATLIRRNNAEDEQLNDNKLLYEDLSYKVRNALFDVKKELGGGHKEIVYQKAVADSLERIGLNFSRETQIPISYRSKKVGIYVPDFVIENKIILELKALPFVGAIEQKQIWSYLKGSGYRLALLANFGPRELHIERIIYDSARDSTSIRHSSASVPHEFRVRSALVPHLLSMTATPIPRTLTMALYGDLDISIINEMPKNRKKIITKAVISEKRNDAYAFIEKEVKKGRQVFVICPKIEHKQYDEGAELSERQLKMQQIKAVKEEYEKLSKKIFPHLKVAMLHGKMKPKEKDETMKFFKDTKFDILVSTSVVEVGVDVPNATIMMIEGSDRFGLAQLHQFRGRVGRGEHQSYCFLFSDSNSEDAKKRLQIMENTSDGFKLAEYDLQMRGPGDFFGEEQSGLPDLAMEALINPVLISETQEEAKKILDKDPVLKNYPVILSKLSKLKQQIHFE